MTKNQMKANARIWLDHNDRIHIGTFTTSLYVSNVSYVASKPVNFPYNLTLAELEQIAIEWREYWDSKISTTTAIKFIVDASLSKGKEN